VRDVETSLDQLQIRVLNGSPPDVRPYLHEDRSSIDKSHTVAHGHHDSDEYAGRGRSGDGESRSAWHRYSGPFEVEACLEGCFGVCILFEIP